MPNNWTLTDQAAIILKSYGCDDVEAARAVVALVLGEAARECDNVMARMIYLNQHAKQQDAKFAAAIRALGVQS